MAWTDMTAEPERDTCMTPTRTLSAQELNAFLDALTESFNNLNLGYVRRSKGFAVPTGWNPDGLTVACFFSGPVSGFLALDIEKRLANRIARYTTPRRMPLTDKDTRLALQAIGEDVMAGMQTRLVQMGIMAQITAPQVYSSDEWRRHHSDKIPVGVIPLYSTCGISHLAFNLSDSPTPA